MSEALAAFFGRFDAAFEEAAARSGPRAECRIKAGVRIFRIRFATAEMQEALLPALEHLSVALNHAEPDDFTLNAWDSASTGAQPPRPVWEWGTSIAKGEITGLNGPRFFGHLSQMSGAISLFDAESRTATYWMADMKMLHGAERAAPFLQIFQWCFQQTGLQVTHGAVAGIPSGAALLTGKSGSGKSTTAALARADGLLHMGDDYCLLGTAPPRVFALFRSIKLHPRSLDLAPLKTRRETTAWKSDDKSVLLPEWDSPRELPLKMILLPRVTGGRATTVRPAGAAEALRALAPSSLFQLPGAGREAFAFFAKLAKELPAFHLDLGTDAGNVAARVRELLEGAAP